MCETLLMMLINVSYSILLQDTKQLPYHSLAEKKYYFLNQLLLKMFEKYESLTQFWSCPKLVRAPPPPPASPLL